MKKIILPFLVVVLFSFSGNDNCKFGFTLKQFEKSIVFVPDGFRISYSNKGDYMLNSRGDTLYVLTKDSTKVFSFYMYNHEVSNHDYLLFVNDLKNRDTSLYRQMLPDTLVWRSTFSFNEPYVDYYFRHPAYWNYPVVGVTYEQANYYCKWLTEEYMKDKKRKFKKVEFKLPTIEQWVYAARGGLERCTFPWGKISKQPAPFFGELSMQNKNGEWMANFQVVPQYGITKSDLYRNILRIMSVDKNCYYDNDEYLVTSGSGNLSCVGDRSQYLDVTAPVISFYPNNYGIYNMAGNVEEYVKEKGITKGGSWMDTGYYLMNTTEENYDSTNYTSSGRGFRFIMEVKE